MKPLFGVLLTLIVVLLFHFVSIVVYHHHHYHINDTHYYDKDYIDTLNKLNSSLTTLNVFLKVKKTGQRNIKSSSSSSSSSLSKQQSSSEPKKQMQQSKEVTPPPRARTALLFTMDSITDYEANSMMGGASGTIVCLSSYKMYSSSYSSLLYHIILYFIRRNHSPPLTRISVRSPQHISDHPSLRPRV